MARGALRISTHVGALPACDLAFTMPTIQVPLAPSTPLALHSVSFRADKNIFLNKAELSKVVECGRKRKNPNPNKKYDTLLLMNDAQEKSVDFPFAIDP